MARLWPHRLEGDGHTIAHLRRSMHDPDPDIGAMAQPAFPTVAAEQSMNEFLAAFVPGFELTTFPVQQGDAIFIVPVIDAYFGGLPMVRKGLWAGTVAPGRFTPSHALALALDPEQCTLVASLDFKEAAHYLSGETIARPGKSGWVLMTFDGFPLGWGKRSGDIIKNHYPKGLRRPVSSWMSAA